MSSTRSKGKKIYAVRQYSSSLCTQKQSSPETKLQQVSVHTKARQLAFHTSILASKLDGSFIGLSARVCEEGFVSKGAIRHQLLSEIDLHHGAKWT